MSLYLFAGIPVDDFDAALAWYGKLLGLDPSHFPNDIEAVWELAEGRLIYIVRRPEDAGHAMLTVIVEDLDALMASVTERGLEPAKQEAYSNGVRKTTYADPDGNEISFGEVPR